MASFIDVFDFRVAGIPCKVGVTFVETHKGCFSHNAPSDLDYYGWTECEYQILDSRERPAPWLERKLTDKIRADIESTIGERANR